MTDPADDPTAPLAQPRRRAAPVRLVLMGLTLGIALYAAYLAIGALS